MSRNELMSKVYKELTEQGLVGEFSLFCVLHAHQY